MLAREAAASISGQLCGVHNLDVVILEKRVGGKASERYYVTQICKPHCPELYSATGRTSRSASGDSVTILGMSLPVMQLV